jgi:glutathione peroxidase
MNQPLYDIELKTIDNKMIKMSEFQNKAILVVNVASKCGFTPQYKGLESLYQELADQGLVVLGFPCNQFGSQEPEGEEQIAQFCELNFGVTFPLFAKVDVNGKDAHPLYQHLKKEAPGLFGTEGIKWNFTKFLINQRGEIVKRYAPQDTPEKIKAELIALLSTNPTP